MRTRFEIVLADEGRDPRALRAAAEQALEEVARVEGNLSAFRRDSVLAEINAEAAVRPVQVDGAVWAFLERAGALSAAVDGAFDLTVGALLEPLRRGAAVDLRGVAAALVGFGRLVRLDREGGAVSFTAAGVRLDAGAIAKGYALERAAEVLREAGVERALLHGGTSSVRAMGAPAGEGGWTVAVQDPRDPAGRLAVVRLRDRALGVSAIHGRTFVVGEQKVGHVLDPRTGEPVAHTLLAAVVTDSATDADALSTALLVLGGEGIAVLRARFPDAGFLVLSAEGTVQIAGDDFAPAAHRVTPLA